MTKICSRCKEEKSINLFYKVKKHKDGLDYNCKSCVGEYNKKKYREKWAGQEKTGLLREQAKSLGLKRCPKCCENKSLDQFSNNKRTSDGKQTYCKECLYPMSKKWWYENHERHLEIGREWYKANREKHLENSRRWSANNLDRKKYARAKRRALEAAAPGSPTFEEVMARMAYYGWKCIYCGDEYTDVDHFFPLSEGGTNFASNLVPACDSCNSRKLACNPWIFIRRNL